MDLFLKFLILGGKYLSQLTAQSIVEAYKRSVQLGRSLHHHCSQSVSVVSNYDNVLEMYNQHLEDFQTNPHSHLAFISDLHRQEFETYLKEVELLTEEDVTALFRDTGVFDSTTAIDESEKSYIRQMAMSILNGTKSRSTTPLTDSSLCTPRSSDDSYQFDDINFDEMTVAQTSSTRVSSPSLPPRPTTSNTNSNNEFATMKTLNFLKSMPFPNIMTIYSDKMDAEQVGTDTAVVNVADFLDRQSEYIQNANNTFRQLQHDISIKYEQMRVQQLQEEQEEAERDLDFVRKLRTVQIEVENCTKLMKCAHDHFEKKEENKRLLVSIDKIITDVEAITQLMRVNDQHFKEFESIQDMIERGAQYEEDAKLIDSNMTSYNKMMRNSVSQQLNNSQFRFSVSSCYPSSITPITDQITRFLSKQQNQDLEKVIDVNQKAFDKHERNMKYPLIGRWNNRMKKSRKRSNNLNREHRIKHNRPTKNPFRNVKKSYKCSKTLSLRQKFLKRSFLKTVSDKFVLQNFAALSSSWIKDDQEPKVRYDNEAVIIEDDRAETPKQIIEINNAIQRFLNVIDANHYHDDNIHVHITKEKQETETAEQQVSEPTQNEVVVDENLDLLVSKLLYDIDGIDVAKRVECTSYNRETKGGNSVAPYFWRPPDKTGVRRWEQIKVAINKKLGAIRKNTTTERKDPFAFSVVRMEGCTKDQYEMNDTSSTKLLSSDLTEIQKPTLQETNKILETAESIEATDAVCNEVTFCPVGNKLGLQQGWATNKVEERDEDDLDCVDNSNIEEGDVDLAMIQEIELIPVESIQRHDLAGAISDIKLNLVEEEPFYTASSCSPRSSYETVLTVNESGDICQVIDAKALIKEITAEIEEKHALSQRNESNKLLELVSEMNLKAKKLMKEYDEQQELSKKLREIITPSENEVESSNEMPVLSGSENTLAAAKPPSKKAVEEEPQEFQKVLVATLNKDPVDNETKNDRLSSQKWRDDTQWIDESLTNKENKGPSVSGTDLNAPQPQNWRSVNTMTRGARKSYTVVKTKSNEVTLIDIINGGKRLWSPLIDAKTSTRQISFNPGFHKSLSRSNFMKRPNKLMPTIISKMNSNKSNDIKLIPMNLLKPNSKKESDENSEDKVETGRNATFTRKAIKSNVRTIKYRTATAKPLAIKSKEKVQSVNNRSELDRAEKNENEKDLPLPNKNMVKLEKIISAESRKIIPSNKTKRERKIQEQMEISVKSDDKIPAEQPKRSADARKVRSANETRTETSAPSIAVSKDMIENIAQPKEEYSKYDQIKAAEASLKEMSNDLKDLKSKLEAAKLNVASPELQNLYLADVAKTVDKVNTNLKDIKSDSSLDINKINDVMQMVHESTIKQISKLVNESEALSMKSLLMKPPKKNQMKAQAYVSKVKNYSQEDSELDNAKQQQNSICDYQTEPTNINKMNVKVKSTSQQKVDTSDEIFQKINAHLKEISAQHMPVQTNDNDSVDIPWRKNKKVYSTSQGQKPSLANLQRKQLLQNKYASEDVQSTSSSPEGILNNMELDIDIEEVSKDDKRRYISKANESSDTTRDDLYEPCETRVVMVGPDYIIEEEGPVTKQPKMVNAEFEAMQRSRKGGKCDLDVKFKAGHPDMQIPEPKRKHMHSKLKDMYNDHFNKYDIDEINKRGQMNNKILIDYSPANKSSNHGRRAERQSNDSYRDDTDTKSLKSVADYEYEDDCRESFITIQSVSQPKSAKLAERVMTHKHSDDEPQTTKPGKLHSFQTRHQSSTSPTSGQPIGKRNNEQGMLKMSTNPATNSLRFDPEPLHSNIGEAVESKTKEFIEEFKARLQATRRNAEEIQENLPNERDINNFTENFKVRDAVRISAPRKVNSQNGQENQDSKSYRYPTLQRCQESNPKERGINSYNENFMVTDAAPISIPVLASPKSIASSKMQENQDSNNLKVESVIGPPTNTTLTPKAVLVPVVKQILSHENNKSEPDDLLKYEKPEVEEEINEEKFVELKDNVAVEEANTKMFTQEFTKTSGGSKPIQSNDGDSKTGTSLKPDKNEEDSKSLLSTDGGNIKEDEKVLTSHSVLRFKPKSDLINRKKYGDETPLRPYFIEHRAQEKQKFNKAKEVLDKNAANIRVLESWKKPPAFKQIKSKTVMDSSRNSALYDLKKKQSLQDIKFSKYKFKPDTFSTGPRPTNKSSLLEKVQLKHPQIQIRQDPFNKSDQISSLKPERGASKQHVSKIPTKGKEFTLKQAASQNDITRQKTSTSKSRPPEATSKREFKSISESKISSAKLHQSSSPRSVTDKEIGAIKVPKLVMREITRKENNVTLESSSTNKNVESFLDTTSSAPSAGRTNSSDGSREEHKMDSMGQGPNNIVHLWEPERNNKIDKNLKSDYTSNHLDTTIPLCQSLIDKMDLMGPGPNKTVNLGQQEVNEPKRNQRIDKNLKSDFSSNHLDTTNPLSQSIIDIENDSTVRVTKPRPIHFSYERVQDSARAIQTPKLKKPSEQFKDKIAVPKVELKNSNKPLEGTQIATEEERNASLTPVNQVMTKAIAPIMTKSLAKVGTDKVVLRAVDMARLTSDMILSGSCVQYLNQLSSDLNNPAYSNLLERCYPEDKEASEMLAKTISPRPLEMNRISASHCSQKLITKTLPMHLENPVNETFFVCSSNKLMKNKGKDDKCTEHLKDDKEVFISVDELQEGVKPTFKTLSNQVLVTVGKNVEKETKSSSSKPASTISIRPSVFAKRPHDEQIPDFMRLKASERERNLKRLIILEEKIKKLEERRAKKLEKDIGRPFEKTLVNVLEEIRCKKSSKYPETAVRRTYQDKSFMGAHYRKSYSNINSSSEKKNTTKQATKEEKMREDLISVKTGLSHISQATQPPGVRSSPLASEPIQVVEPVPNKKNSDSNRNAPLKRNKKNLIPENPVVPQLKIPAEEYQWKLPIAKRKNLLPYLSAELKNTKIVVPKTTTKPPPGGNQNNKSHALPRRYQDVRKRASARDSIPEDSTNMKEKKLIPESNDKDPPAPKIRKTLMSNAMTLPKMRRNQSIERNHSQFEMHKLKQLKSIQKMVSRHNLALQSLNMTDNKKKQNRKDICHFTNNFGKHLARLKVESEREKLHTKDANEYQRELTERLQKLSSLPKRKEKIQEDTSRFVYKPPMEKGIRDTKKPSLSDVKRTIIKHLKSAPIHYKRPLERFLEDKNEVALFRQMSSTRNYMMASSQLNLQKVITPDSAIVTDEEFEAINHDTSRL